MSEESIESIQQRMRTVRRELGNDLAESARDITNWRSYVRASPWLCLGGAALIGYLIVPKKSPKLQFNSAELQALMRDSGAAVAAVVPEPKKPGMSSKLSRMVLSNVSALLLRGALAYVGQRMAGSRLESDRHEEAPF